MLIRLTLNYLLNFSLVKNDYGLPPLCFIIVIKEMHLIYFTPSLIMQGEGHIVRFWYGVTDECCRPIPLGSTLSSSSFSLCQHQQRSKVPEFKEGKYTVVSKSGETHCDLLFKRLRAHLLYGI